MRNGKLDYMTTVRRTLTSIAGQNAKIALKLKLMLNSVFKRIMMNFTAPKASEIL